MQDQLQSLLNQISEIIKEEKELKQLKYERGDSFNVFEVLKLQRNEVRLHSAFISTLLDPKGSHGLKTKPLASFLRIMDADGILDDLATVKAEKEVFIGQISKNGEDGGRMDIVLMDKHKNAIVIENKIDAKDQPKQLLRYDNYCKKHFKNYRIYYLTKWGVAPSDESCGRQDFDYWTASYNEDIFSWLDDCIALSDSIRPVNETIKQYRTNLVEILNIMSQNSKNEFLSVVTADKNIESTLAILENQSIIGRKIRFDFLQRLIALAKEYGFEGDKAEAEDLAYVLVLLLVQIILQFSLALKSLHMVFGFLLKRLLSERYQDQPFNSCISNGGYTILKERKLTIHTDGSISGVNLAKIALANGGNGMLRKLSAPCPMGVC